MGEIEPDIQDLFVQAFLKDQEGRWILRAVDDLWTRHLTGMESLRESIGLQAYAQRDPLIEYKRNSYELFDELKRQIRQVAVGVLSLRVVAPEQQPIRRQAAAAANTPAPAIAPPANDASALVGAGAAKGGNGSNDGASRQQAARNDRAPRGARPAAAAAPAAAVSGAVRKVGRNDPCPCGSGKKYKMCHGR